MAFDVLRGISFALTISFPLSVLFLHHGLADITLSSITDSAGMFINWLNDVVAQRAYSRKLEIEADAFGIDVRLFFVPSAQHAFREKILAEDVIAHGDGGL